MTEGPSGIQLFFKGEAQLKTVLWNLQIRTYNYSIHVAM